MNFSDKIFSISTDAEFEVVALELFRRQAALCTPYREYISLLGVDPAQVERVEDIPFMPIEFFKWRDVYCGEGDPE